MSYLQSDYNYAPRSRVSRDAPSNSFQNELKSRMKDRKARGLAADITESESNQGSDDELGSDDGKYQITSLVILRAIIAPLMYVLDLLAGFNMTSKPKWAPPGPQAER